MSSIIEGAIKPVWLATLGHWVVATDHAGSNIHKLLYPADLSPMYKAVVSVVPMKLSFQHCLSNTQAESSSPAPRGRASLSPGTAGTLPYTGREYTPCHALSRKTQWSEPHSSHPGRFWWCHCGRCRPGRGPWHSANSTHSLEGHWTHTLPLGKAGASSQLLLAAREWTREKRGRKGRTGQWFLFLDHQNPQQNVRSSIFFRIGQRELWKRFLWSLSSSDSLNSPGNLFVSLWKGLPLCQKMKYEQNWTISLLSYTFFSVRNLSTPPPIKQHKIRQHKIWFPSLISHGKLYELDLKQFPPVGHFLLGFKSQGFRDESNLWAQKPTLFLELILGLKGQKDRQRRSVALKISPDKQKGKWPWLQRRLSGDTSTAKTHAASFTSNLHAQEQTKSQFKRVAVSL